MANKKQPANAGCFKYNLKLFLLELVVKSKTKVCP